MRVVTIIPNIAHLRQSIIAFDVKGTIAATTARKRAKMGRVIMVNPFNYLVKERPHLKSQGWNPLLQLDPKSDEFATDADSVADAIITKNSGSSSGAKFFDISAENLISLFVMWERIKNGGKADLRNIPATLSLPFDFDKKTKEPIGGLAIALKDMTQSNVYAIRTPARYIYGRLTDGSSQTTSMQDVIATVLKDFKFLNSDVAAFDMSRGVIDFAALHREITTIYLILGVEKLDPQGMGKWLRLFVNLALRALYQNAPTDKATLPRVLLILDEFAQLGRLQEIPKALGALREFSGCFWFVLQNLSQLKTNYPDEWSLFFTGSGSINCFRAKDLETAEYFSKIIGDRQQKVVTENHRGISTTDHALPLIRPEDLMRLPPRTTVNLIDPCPYPILAHVPLYTQTPWNKGLDPNPYYRG